MSDYSVSCALLSQLCLITPSVVRYLVNCVVLSQLYDNSVSCALLSQLCISFGQLYVSPSVAYFRSVVHLILAGQLCITWSVAHYSVSCVLFCQLWITISRLHDDTVSCVSVLGQ